jgi:hypothetical protein
MDLKELYEVGWNFETFVGTGTRSERERIPKNYSRINFSEELKAEIENVDKKINFLISAEMWCYDAQLNTTVVKKLCEMNSKFEMKVITKGRGEKYLKPILEVEEFKIPTIVVMDEDYNLLVRFIERPLPVKAVENFEDIKIEYLKGAYLSATAEELLNIIKK